MLTGRVRDSRIREIQELSARSKRRAEDATTCVLGVSGGKDSLRQALWLRDVAGISPLCVCLSAPPSHNTDLGASNISNLVALGFDVLSICPAPETWRDQCLRAFLQFGNYAVASELALYAAAPQVAIERGYGLVLIGENPDFRDPATLESTPYAYQGFAKQRTLRGGDQSWFPAGLQASGKAHAYRIPSQGELDDAGVAIVDLSWFMPEWSNLGNAEFAVAHGLTVDVRSPSEIGDIEGVSALDDSFVAVNQMMKYYKFGFGKVTDYMNEQIRSQRVSRTDAIPAVEALDGACDTAIVVDFCSWLGIDWIDFWRTVRAFSHSELFRWETGTSRPAPRFIVGIGTQ